MLREWQDNAEIDSGGRGDKADGYNGQESEIDSSTTRVRRGQEKKFSFLKGFGGV